MQSPAILAGSVDRPNIFLGVETGLTDKEKALKTGSVIARGGGANDHL